MGWNHQLEKLCLWRFLATGTLKRPLTYWPFAAMTLWSWSGQIWDEVAWRKLSLQAEQAELPGSLWICVFPKIGGKPPKWMVYFMENPMNKWMIWGLLGTTIIFGNTHMPIIGAVRGGMAVADVWRRGAMCMTVVWGPGTLFPWIRGLTPIVTCARV